MSPDPFSTIFHSFPSILYYILLLSPLYLPPFSTTTFLFNLSSLYLFLFFIFFLSPLYLPSFSTIYLSSFSSISSSFSTIFSFFLFYIFLLSLLYLHSFSTISLSFFFYIFQLHYIFLLSPFSTIFHLSSLYLLSFSSISSSFLFYIVLLFLLYRPPFSAMSFSFSTISLFFLRLSLSHLQHIFLFTSSRFYIFSLFFSPFFRLSEIFLFSFLPPAFSSAFSHQPFPLMKISLNLLDYTKSRLHCM